MGHHSIIYSLNLFICRLSHLLFFDFFASASFLWELCVHFIKHGFFYFLLVLFIFLIDWLNRSLHLIKLFLFHLIRCFCWFKFTSCLHSMKFVINIFVLSTFSIFSFTSRVHVRRRRLMTSSWATRFMRRKKIHKLFYFHRNLSLKLMSMIIVDNNNTFGIVQRLAGVWK